MGSGISSHATRQTASSTASSETFVGKSLASVLSDTGGTNVDENGRLEYPENVHAVLDVERYVVDENGLRRLLGGDSAGPKGVWWNDSTRSMTADVTGAEEELSQPEGATQLEATMAPQTDVSREGQGIPLGVSHLAERSVGEVSWDRFRTGTIIGPDPEPKQSSRPSTPPNLIRTLQENVSAARYAAYQMRRVAELTAPQLAETLGLKMLSDTRYAKHAKPHVGVSMVEDKEFIPGWVAEETTSVDNISQPLFWTRDGEVEEGEGDGENACIDVGAEDREEMDCDIWCEGHGLNRWRQEFDQARAILRTKLAIKDSRGAMVIRKPPPPPEEPWMEK